MINIKHIVDFVISLITFQFIIIPFIIILYQINSSVLIDITVSILLRASCAFFKIAYHLFQKIVDSDQLASGEANR